MRRLALGSSVVGAVFVGLVLLRPVLLGPVTGDDVYYSLNAAADPDATILTEIAGLPQEWRNRVADGRVNVLTAVERRTSGRAMVETAVATGRPVHQVLGVFKIGYAALSLFAVYALLRAIRWRRRDSGALVQMAGRTRTIAMVAGGLAFAVGAEPQVVGLHGLNGWLSYPVSTWTAAFSIFGVVALTLWLARLAAARGRVVAVPAALLLIVIGALSNYRYELTFPALPLTLLALALLPVSDLEDRAAGRRAKWVLGSAYVLGFVPVLVANRMLLSEGCNGGGCYEGVSLALGRTMFRTFGINVISSLPGTGREEVLALLNSESIRTDGTWTPTLWSVLTALALVATLALAWRASGPRQTESAEPEETRAQAVLCVVGAAILMAGALGAAAVMSLSERAQSYMSEIGLLYRHSVITWSGLAFGVVLLVLALGLWRPRLAVPSFVALALVMALVVSTKMPADERVMAANTSRMKPTIEVFNEVVRGETGDRANHRRCRILRDVDREMSSFYAPNVRRSAKRSFERYWHAPFCDRG
jgi:hypothetical protein